MKNDRVKMGVVCSSGGAAAMAAWDIVERVYPGALEYVVVVNRECGMEDGCRARNIPCQRIDVRGRDDLSKAIATYMSDKSVDVTLLYFDRIVTGSLFNIMPTMNIHPALLPAFKGKEAVRQALNARARFLGATLHMVTEMFDEGPIVAQVVHPLTGNVTEAEANSLSFCQKVYLQLLLFTWLRNGQISFLKSDVEGYDAVLTGKMSRHVHASPAIEDALLVSAYNAYLREIDYSAWSI